MTPHQPRHGGAPHQPAIDEIVEAYERFMQTIAVGHTPEVVETHLSMAQMKVLYILGSRREIHMSELTSMLGVSLSTVSGLVDRLVEAGFASRREDPADRRHVVVAVSPTGITLLDRFRELGTSQFRALLAGLSSSELTTVHAAIDLLTTAAGATARKERT